MKNGEDLLPLLDGLRRVKEDIDAASHGLLLDDSDLLPTVISVLEDCLGGPSADPSV